MKIIQFLSKVLFFNKRREKKYTYFKYAAPANYNKRDEKNKSFIITLYIMYFVAIKMIKIAGKTVIMKGKTVHVLFMCLFEHMYIFVSMTAIKMQL